MTLVHELEVIPDEDNQWDYEKLFREQDIQFSRNSGGRPTQHRYWARCWLTNSAIRDQYLSFESNYWDFVNIFIHDSTGHVERLNLGILNKNPKSTFILRAQSEIMLLAKFESSGEFRRESNINLVIYKTITGLTKTGFTNYMDGIIFGIIFGLALYNLFLFISLRDMTYFWYTAYIYLFAITYITLFISSPSKLTQYFIPSHPYIAFYIKKLGDPLVWVSYTQFARHFLQTKTRHPNWDLVLKIFIGLTLLQLLLNLIGWYQFTGFDRVVIWNVITIICVILAFKSYYQGFTIAKFFLLGQTFLVLGIIIALFYYTDRDLIWFLPHNQFFDYFRSPNSVFSCAAIESVLFSFALADKYNLLQRDIARVTLEKEQQKQAMLAAQNETLEKQVKERTTELSESIENLKATQAQLIQAEKMASLGELTSGIAHEIQNPLNFVNNFSEINVELLEDLEAHWASYIKEKNGSLESEILKNLKKNTEKINHHGKRVDSIVKGMLQHSRQSNGVKELIDINALCDECLRLAYHGFRAKEKAFNAQFATEFDPELPKLKGTPQDIGRVILNIVNNAFYAVTEMKKNSLKTSTSNEPSADNYQPRIKVVTRREGQDIVILISDNGPGIPSKIMDKIFQPFFTTKPTGEGTGLGLSLSYDIITKAHHGLLKVKSEEGEGTEFQIIIPTA
jgi:signal transduction histidine kinase